MEYKQQLLTKEWKAKRLIILKRDNFKCRCCGSEFDLQVHHKKYIFGRLSWEYPDSLLLSVCGKCYLFIHKTNVIKSEKDIFKIKKKKVVVVKKKKKKSKNRYSDMNNKDIILQKKYDAYNLKQKTFKKNQL